MKKTNSEISGQKICRIIIFMIFLAAFFLGGISVRTEAATTTISATTVSNTVVAGSSTSYPIRINRNGYTDKVALSVPDAPSDVPLVFSPKARSARAQR